MFTLMRACVCERNVERCEVSLYLTNVYRLVFSTFISQETLHLSNILSPLLNIFCVGTSLPHFCIFQKTSSFNGESFMCTYIRNIEFLQTLFLIPVHNGAINPFSFYFPKRITSKMEFNWRPHNFRHLFNKYPLSPISGLQKASGFHIFFFIFSASFIFIYFQFQLSLSIHLVVTPTRDHTTVRNSELSFGEWPSLKIYSSWEIITSCEQGTPDRNNEFLKTIF